ncbi:MAG: MFS transporter [Actinomycetales bacterium]|nr:MFS transporter [Actinomycetales bacterium]
MSATTAGSPAATDPRRPAPSARAQAVAVVAAGFGQNAVLTIVTTFLLAYLIQYVGISSAGIAVVTVVLTLAKVIDAITDPIMGSLVDMTRTRWGKMRPYILFSAAPVAVLTALLFAVPEGPEAGQLVFFAVVYLLWGLAYTACDVPFWGLIGSAFPEPRSRARVIGNVRAFGAISLGLVTLGLPWLAHALSGGEETTGSGWTLAVALTVALGMALYLLAFAVPRERASEAASRPLRMRELFGALLRNTPLLLILLGSILGFGRQIVQAGGAVFVVVAYDDEGAFTLVGGAIIAGLVIAAFLTPFVLRAVSARALMVGSSLVAAAVYTALWYVGWRDLVAVVVVIFLSGLTLGVFVVVQTTMIADAVDDAEARTGIRNDGISFASLTFVSKIMGALSVLAFGLVVVATGYQDGVAVTPAMQDGVFAGISLVPAVSCLLSAIPFLFVRVGRDARSSLNPASRRRRGPGASATPS